MLKPRKTDDNIKRSKEAAKQAIDMPGITTT